MSFQLSRVTLEDNLYVQVCMICVGINVEIISESVSYTLKNALEVCESARTHADPKWEVFSAHECNAHAALR